MPGSTTSVFSEPDDYQAALRSHGEVDLCVTGRGEFKAQLTQISLRRMHLVAGSENLPRVAFIRLPARLARISLPARGSGSLYSGGGPSLACEIVTLGPGQSMHERTNGPCRWRVIWIPASDLITFGRAMIGATFNFPPGICRWQPTRQALRRLNRLHDDATRMNKVQPRVVAGAEAVRGLEQELIDALIECMLVKAPDAATATDIRHADIMRCFEDLLLRYPQVSPPIAEICAALDVPARTLRGCCKAFLGVAPRRYLHLRLMQFARHALRCANPPATSVREVAHHYGFTGLGHFAASYREQFGELPSVTLQNKGDGMT